MIKIDPTKLEKISGGLPAGISATTFSALAALSTPLAVFVPFLLQSLATGRHTKRVDNALKDINEILISHEQAITDLTDNQFRLINEVIASIFQTIDDEKILFLKTIVNNAITQEDIIKKDVDYISRIMRDISVDEIQFIIKNFKHGHLFIGDKAEIKDALIIKNNSKEEIIVSGLINMGLLYTKVSVFGGTRFDFSPVVVKLLVLLQN